MLTNAERCKRYRDKHKEELNAKLRLKRKGKQDAVLVSLITDYVEGLTIKELCDKYRVNKR